MLQMATCAGISCQICHVMFTDQSTLNAHYDTMHNTSRGAHACDICDKRFTTKAWRRHHMATAHGVGEARKFTCDICSREFSQKSNLTSHIKRKHKLWKCGGYTLSENTNFENLVVMRGQSTCTHYSEHAVKNATVTYCLAHSRIFVRSFAVNV